MAALRSGPGAGESLRIAEESDGFAGVYPEDKHFVVRVLQEGGLVVGMTGDGVNDAPARKQVEVGIATSNAADVARKAASVVLTGEGLEGIVELVKVAVSLGAVVVAEAMLLLYVAFYHLGYGDNTGQLYTLVFDYLVFSTVFNILILRERGRFYRSAPGRLLALSVAADIVAAFLISGFGVHELAAVSPLATLAVLGYAFVTCVLANDTLKVALMGRLEVP